MDIAMIGSGNVGKALGGALVRAGHNVTMTATRPEHAREAAEAIGARPARSNQEAVQGAAVVILAVPTPSLEGAVRELAELLREKVVIDVTNPFDPDDPASAINGRSNAEQVQAWAPGARVVKAFNTAFAARLADPVEGAVRLDGFVAADDQEAKTTALDLARGIGFRPIDAGGLPMARALEAHGDLEYRPSDTA
jgi:8-hydroxy-5-deazaflavin:NADPH oxidoreductase